MTILQKVFNNCHVSLQNQKKDIKENQAFRTVVLNQVPEPTRGLMKLQGGFKMTKKYLS